MAERARFEFQTDVDTKLLAERAAAAAGCASVSEFVNGLIRENAPKILEQQKTIILTNAAFDQFAEACQAAPQPLSPKIVAAADRLDKEGF